LHFVKSWKELEKMDKMGSGDQRRAWVADGVSTQLWKRGEGGELERGWQGVELIYINPHRPKF